MFMTGGAEGERWPVLDSSGRRGVGLILTLTLTHLVEAKGGLG